MSKRMQVVLPEEELEQLRRAAAREGLSLSEWARRVLHRARESQSGPTKESKLAALERALECDHPTGGIEELLEQIESGRDLR